MRMKSGIRLLAAVAIVTGTVHATTINFDVLPGGGAIASGTVLTTQYLSLGVTFTGFEDGVEFAPEIRSQQFISVPNSLPNYLTNFHHFPSTAAPDRLDEIRMTFATGVTNVQMVLNTAGTNDITFAIYNTVGTLLSTVTRSGSGASNVAITLPGTNVGRISAFQPTDTWWYSIDDLQFDQVQAGVPEPTTMTCLFAGLALLGAFKAFRR